MHLISHTSNQPLARVFALVALLCAGALQMQEAGHDHSYSMDGSYSQCLVCKTPEAMTPSQLSIAPTPVPGAAIYIQYQQAVISVAGAFLQARGPPIYS